MPGNTFLASYSINQQKPKSKEEFQIILDSLKTTGKVPSANPAMQPQTDYVQKALADMTAVDAELQKQKDLTFNNKVRSGWTQDTANQTSYSGIPQTQQERDWVRNFTESNGRIPLDTELSAWSATQDRTSWEFAPDSHMRSLGFKNMQEFKDASYYSEPYGLWTGSSVPEGSTVLQNEKGQPWLRTFQPEAYAQHGIVPKTNKDMYPSYDRARKKPGSNEQLLSTYQPQAVYRARVSDYLDTLVNLDTPKITDAQVKQQEVVDRYNSQIDNFNNQLEDGTLTQTEVDDYTKNIDASTKADLQYWQDIIDNAWTEDRKTQTLDQITSSIEGTTDLTQLPFYQESQDIIGQAVTGLLTGAATNFNTKESQRLKDIPPAYQRKSGVAVTTGSEQRDYYTWIDNLPTAIEWKTWLSDNYYGYYDMWFKANSGLDFVSWVKDYIKRGG